MTPPSIRKPVPAPQPQLSSDPGALRGRSPTDPAGGPEPKGYVAAPASPARQPWSYHLKRLAVSLLFLPAEAVKDVLERRPGALRRPGDH